jgi:hypothetical protein
MILHSTETAAARENAPLLEEGSLKGCAESERANRLII